MIIQGVDRYRVVEAMYEGIRVVLSQRGEHYSPAYVQGISGAAFHIGGICPCAPTCTPGIDPADLVRMLGFEAEAIQIPQKGPAQDGPLAAMIGRVKSEIRDGRAALVWNAFTTAEWDVVCGFDDAEGVFYGRGSYAGMDDYAKAHETRTREFDPALGAILVGKKTGAFDAPKAEADSLREAVRHARSRRNADVERPGSWVFLDGLLCYERWARDFRSNPEKKREAGDAYCYGIYRSTHRAASDYLKELAPRYPAADSHLLAAARHFSEEADTLDSGERLLWWNSPEGVDAARNAEAADLLESACSSYRQGIEEIEKALKSI